jgi:acyl-CoA-binding protein
LYAYYKVAKGNEAKPNNDKPIVSAFKANALMQVGHLPKEIAEGKYTELVRQLM